MRAIVAAIAVAGLGVVAAAQPLKMTYSVTPQSGGLYEYEFRLTLTNEDGSWAPGQGFGWIIFGDAQAQLSPINDFVGDESDLPVGPFPCYSGSGGFHNGPTFCVVEQEPPFSFLYWRPTEIGESLEWSGTSATAVEEGQMLWSSLITDGGANPIYFAVAQRENGCRVDFDGDGFVDFFDFSAYVSCFEGIECPSGRSADFDGDGFVDFFDFAMFVEAFEEGC